MSEVTNLQFSGSERALVPGALRGYRAWLCNNRNGVLLPLSSGWLATKGEPVNAWPVQWPLTAVCYPVLAVDIQRARNRRFRPHVGFEEAPARLCACGIYAMHSPNGDYDRFTSSMVFSYGEIVHGSIRAWGRVVIGELGFRAERAQVEAVWSDYPFTRSNVAMRYGVPSFESKEDFLKAFPPTGVRDLLEENDVESGVRGPR